MRADAQRNHDKILAAAEEIFALDGVAVPIDIVAERAGVGIGTLYRHFPTKEALYEAIVVARLSNLLATRRRIRPRHSNRASRSTLSCENSPARRPRSRTSSKLSAKQGSTSNHASPV